MIDYPEQPDPKRSLELAESPEIRELRAELKRTRAERDKYERLWMDQVRDSTAAFLRGHDTGKRMFDALNAIADEAETTGDAARILDIVKDTLK